MSSNVHLDQLTALYPDLVGAVGFYRGAYNGWFALEIVTITDLDHAAKQFLGFDTSTPGKVRYTFQTFGAVNLTLDATISGGTFGGPGGAPDGGTITEASFLDPDGNTLATYTFTAVDADDFHAAVTNDNNSTAGGRFQYLVSLFDDATSVTGSIAHEAFEVGSGDDTVDSGDGNDLVYKWKAGALDYDGGDGSDTLSFQASYGPYPVAPPTTGAVVDLGAGTGTNPYGAGGALTLVDVENVIGTEAASGDQLTGSDKDNIFGDGLYDIGADVIQALGGNDLVHLAEGVSASHAAVNANGGTGFDTLAVNFGLGFIAGPHRLDLTNQANNTGIFGNSTYTNFEVFIHGRANFVPTGASFTFIDNAQGHVVEAMGEINVLTLNGGNDTVQLLDSSIPAGYDVTANAGTGRDTLLFEVKFFATPNNVLDLLHQNQNSGIFANSTFTGFEVFTHVEANGGFVSTQKFTFRGSNLGDTVVGTYGIDNLTGRGGGDTLGGGLGNDVLNGGAGRDFFVFNSAIKPVANIDTIVGFTPADDTIRLDNAIFGGIGGNGALAGIRFHRGAHAHDANDRIIYNPASGALLYDANGIASGQETKFATLANGLGVGAADFIVI